VNKYQAGPILLIGSASVLTVGTGVVLKEAGQSDSIAVIAGAMGLGGLFAVWRFLLWRSAHHRYPLSMTYPLTGLTFPLALVVSALYGEPIGSLQVLATVLITLGVILIHRSGRTRPR
jgi:drug/metabolite transporter (DMT)-like permease